MTDRDVRPGVPLDPALAGVSDQRYPETEEFRLRLPVGAGAVLAALCSLTACYAEIVAITFFGSAAGLGLNPHVQAVLMWSLAVIAVVFLWRNHQRHGSYLPLGIGALAAATLIGTLYLGYDQRIEAMAYGLLVIAALLNQNLLLNWLNRTVRRQAREIEGLNRQLTDRVEDQEDQIDRLGRLKQFLAPQVAELVVGDGSDALLATHRRYIACLFCDIRNFTAVSEAIEPEEVIAILQDFHDRIGDIVAAHGGTIGFRSGDGLMVFFNDPVPCDAPVLEAVRVALAVRERFEEIRAPWQKMGHKIGLGIGIASGYATLGLVGISGRADYTAIGGVVNTASRLCDSAADGQILLSQRSYMDVEEVVDVEPIGSLVLKGLASPVQTYALQAERSN